jgi:homoserine O-succinyltransferase
MRYLNMTIVIPNDYPTKEALENRRIVCMPESQAKRQDIRALRIGILNIMPEAENYEFNLLFPLGRSILQIIPVWIRLKSHSYSSSNQGHLDRHYVSFEEAVKDRHLDGLLISGAPVEKLAFEDVTYWSELQEIMDYAREHIASTLGICWGGLALAKHIGIPKINYKKKLFGVFQTKNLDTTHPITGEMDDIYAVPNSRHAGVDEVKLEELSKSGDVNLLAKSDEAGYMIFETTDHRFVMHLGHFEYDADRLVEEYKRDMALERDDVEPPRHVNLENPVNLWRAQNTEFFTQWIKYVYETTPY